MTVARQTRPVSAYASSQGHPRRDSRHTTDHHPSRAASKRQLSAKLSRPGRDILITRWCGNAWVSMSEQSSVRLCNESDWTIGVTLQQHLLVRGSSLCSGALSDTLDSVPTLLSTMSGFVPPTRHARSPGRSLALFCFSDGASCLRQHRKGLVRCLRPAGFG